MKNSITSLLLYMLWCFVSVPAFAQSAFSNVAVFVNNPSGGTGTGFLVQGRDTLVTNRHVIEGAQRVTLHYIENDDIVSVPARVIHVFRAEADDLAVLKAERPVSVDRLRLVPKVPLSGLNVIAVGFPAAARVFDSSRLDVVRPTVTRGAISRIAGQNVQHDASLNGGNSGGPLLDACNQVLGINTAISRGAQGIGVALSSQRVIEALQSVGLSPSTGSGACAGGFFDFLWKPNVVRNIVIAMVPLSLLAWWAFVRAGYVPAFPFGSGSQQGNRYSGFGIQEDDFQNTTNDRFTTLECPSDDDNSAFGGVNSSRDDGFHTASASNQHMRLSNSGEILPGAVLIKPEGCDVQRILLSDISQTGLVIGRDPRENDIVLSDHSVSRRHALLRAELRDGAPFLILEDLGSANGTFVGGNQILDPTELDDFEEITIGELTVSVELQRRGSDVDRSITDLHRIYGGEKPRDARFSHSVFFSNAGWQLSGIDELGNVITVPLHGKPDRDVEIVLGRDGADYDIDHSSVSRHHAKVSIRPGRAPAISDLGSTNGTFVNGEEVGSSPRSLYNASAISLGDLVLELSVQAV